jgi:hypothetical protein
MFLIHITTSKHTYPTPQFPPIQGIQLVPKVSASENQSNAQGGKTKNPKI